MNIIALGILADNIALSILNALHHQHTIYGVQTLARMVNADPRCVRKRALTLAAWGLIRLTPGKCGRGNATIFQDAGALKQIDQEQSS